MAAFFERLEEQHRQMIGRQAVFFVSTAAADGRINLSPKGYDAFRVICDQQVAYLDLAGSGNETHAHLCADQADTGRITLMFCEFQNPPLILRIYGRGRPVLPQDAEWAGFAAHFKVIPGTRQIFVIEIDSVQTSCGWGVPMMTLEKERETLAKYHAKADREAWLKKAESRTRSIDGLPVRTTDRFVGDADL
jgi:hypothetical protein